MDVNIIGQQGDHTYMIDVGTDTDGLDLVRVYDLLMDTYGPPILLGSLLAHTSDWGPVTSVPGILDLVRERVVAKPRLAALRGGNRVVGDLHGVAVQ